MFYKDRFSLYYELNYFKMVQAMKGNIDLRYTMYKEYCGVGEDS